MPSTRSLVTAVGLGVAVTFVLAVWLAPLRYKAPVFMWATGRAHGCDVAALMRAGVRAEEVRRLRWELHRASRAIGHDKAGSVFETPEGTFLVPSGTDLFGLLAEQRQGIYDHGRVRLDESMVIDAGANVGAYTRHALARGARKVVAIEPVPRNVAALRWTFHREIEQGRVVVVPTGLWDRQDTLRMWTYENSALDSFVMSSRPESLTPPRAMDLPLTTLDRVVGDMSLDSVDIVKMDIEGAEHRALEGARQTLRLFGPALIIAAENRDEDYLELPRVIRSIDQGYSIEFGPCSMTNDALRRETLFAFTR